MTLDKVSSLPDDWFVYGTCIRTTLEDPRDGTIYSVGNNTEYSNTARKWQEMVNVQACDIIVDRLPRKCTPDDLRAKALLQLMVVTPCAE